MGKKLQSLSLYISAKVFQEKLQEADPLSTTYSNLANLYADFGDSSREIQFLEKSKFIPESFARNFPPLIVKIILDNGSW